MSAKGLVWIILCWCLLRIIEYYFLIYFIVSLLWVGLSLVLLITLIVKTYELVKLIRKHETITKLRVANIVVFSILLYFTLNHRLVNDIIEKIDWKLLYNKRMEIIEQVKEKQLNPNVNWNNVTCQLPFDFPVVSNGGNKIIISRNEEQGVLSVTFFIFLNFFEAPTSYFIYTNDGTRKAELEELIKKDPANNWKIDENWYRALSE